MGLSTKQIIGLAAVVGLGLYLRNRSQSSGTSAARPIRNPDGSYVIAGGTDYQGVPAGTLTAYRLSNGNVLDPRGVPLGAKLADGTTWHGVEVVQTRATPMNDDPSDL